MPTGAPSPRVPTPRNTFTGGAGVSSKCAEMNSGVTALCRTCCQKGTGDRRQVPGRAGGQGGGWRPQGGSCATADEGTWAHTALCRPLGAGAPQAGHELLLLREEVQQHLAGVAEGLLDLLHVRALLQRVDDLFGHRAGDVTATLSDHIQIFSWKGMETVRLPCLLYT